jgi:putative membrane protein
MADQILSNYSDKKIGNAIKIISIAVFAAVVVLFNLPQADHIPAFVKYLPGLNAIINTTCSLLLISSFIMIRKGNVKVHRNLNLAAFTLSALFLVSYVIFHSFGIETKFPADNPLRSTYLIILITHIILAALVLPLVLFAFYRGLNMQVEKHKKIVRWAFPIWLYVTISGVVVYLMISPYYNF